MDKNKKQIFIASSCERLDVAHNLQRVLEKNLGCECTTWDENVFKPSSYPMVDLKDQLDKSDYGIFVFVPDDETTQRGQTNLTVRDNIVFELGLFMGRLGRECCFIVMPDNVKNVMPDNVKNVHIPTDLMGIKPLTYKPNREDKNLVAALTHCVYEIEQSIRNKTDYFENPLRLPKNRFGARSIYFGKDEDKLLDEDIEKAKDIKMIFTTGIHFGAKYRHKIRNALESGCHVSLLIATPQSEYIEDLHEIQRYNNFGEKCSHDLNEELKEITKPFKDLQLKKGQVTIGHYSTHFRANMIIFDDNHGFYTPTLPPTNSRAGICFELSEGGLLNACIIHFNSIMEALQKRSGVIERYGKEEV